MNRLVLRIISLALFPAVLLDSVSASAVAVATLRNDMCIQRVLRGSWRFDGESPTIISENAIIARLRSRFLGPMNEIAVKEMRELKPPQAEAHEISKPLAMPLQGADVERQLSGKKTSITKGDILGWVTAGLVTPPDGAAALMRMGIDPGLVDVAYNRRLEIPNMARQPLQGPNGPYFPGSMSSTLRVLRDTTEWLTATQIAAVLRRSPARVSWNLRGLFLLGKGGTRLVERSPVGSLAHGEEYRFRLTEPTRTHFGVIDAIIAKVPRTQFTIADIEHLRPDVQAAIPQKISPESPLELTDLPAPARLAQQRLDSYLLQPASVIRPLLREIPVQMDTYGTLHLNSLTKEAEAYLFPDRDLAFVRQVYWNDLHGDCVAAVGFHLGRDGRPDLESAPAIWFLFYLAEDGTHLRVRYMDGSVEDIVFAGDLLKHRYLSGLPEFVYQRAMNDLRFPRRLTGSSDSFEPTDVDGLIRYLMISGARGRQELNSSIGNVNFHAAEEHGPEQVGTPVELFFDSVQPVANVALFSARYSPPGSRWKDAPAVILLREITRAGQTIVVVDRDGASSPLTLRIGEKQGLSISLPEASVYRRFLAQLAKPFYGRILKGRFSLTIGGFGLYFNVPHEMLVVRRPGEVYSSEGEENNRVFFLDPDNPVFKTPLQDFFPSGQPVSKGHLPSETLGQALQKGEDIPLAPIWVQRLAAASFVEIRVRPSDPDNRGQELDVFLNGETRPAWTYKAYKVPSKTNDSPVHFSFQASLFAVERAQCKGDLPNRVPVKFLDLFNEPQWRKVRAGGDALLLWQDPTKPIQIVQGKELAQATSQVGIREVVALSENVGHVTLPQPTPLSDLPGDVQRLEKALVDSHSSWASMPSQPLKTLVRAAKKLGLLTFALGGRKYLYFTLPEEWLQNVEYTAEQAPNLLGLVGFRDAVAPRLVRQFRAWATIYKKDGAFYLRVGDHTGALAEDKLYAGLPKGKSATFSLMKSAAFVKFMEKVLGSIAVLVMNLHLVQDRYAPRQPTAISHYMGASA